MSSSRSTGASSRIPSLMYNVRCCKCDKMADIKIVESTANRGKLYYTCRLKNCNFFYWCSLIAELSSSCNALNGIPPAEVYGSANGQGGFSSAKLNEDLSEIKKGLLEMKATSKLRDQKLEEKFGNMKFYLIMLTVLCSVIVCVVLGISKD